MCQFVVEYPISMIDKPGYPAFPGAVFDGAKVFPKWRRVAIFYMGNKIPTWAEARAYGHVFGIPRETKDHLVDLSDQ